ncbi:Hydroxyacid oxidase 1 [Gonapodya sp. JEL0774]|nr:Hydroxyacid oxidase 1 [Gonapodya sp. JEL0774]
MSGHREPTPEFLEYEADFMPVCVNDLVPYCERKLKPAFWEHIRDGAMDSETHKNNTESFKRIRIRPRVLRDVSNIDTTVKLFGHTFASPIGLSPTGSVQMCHPEGEKVFARTVARMNQAYMCSTATTVSLEDVAAEARNVPDYPFAKAAKLPNLFFQLYVFGDKKVTEALVKRAEKEGYTAMVVTVDTPRLGRRLTLIRRPGELGKRVWANFATKEEDASKFANKGGNLGLSSNFSDTLNWDTDIKWLRSITKLPIILKGIMSGEDAELAIQAGIDGIYVSNHGGRQLDTIPSTLEALPEIARVAKGKIPILFDGGVRKGTDVFKALALGADYVFIGRPALLGLTWKADEGIEQVLNWLNEELRLAMVLAGTTSVKDITKAFVRHESEYWKL